MHRVAKSSNDKNKTQEIFFRLSNASVFLSVSTLKARFLRMTRPLFVARLFV